MADAAPPRAGLRISRQHTLVLFPELAELVRLTAWADEIGQKLALSMQRLYALQLCLQELAATVIVNAKPRVNLPMSIVVTLIPRQDGLEVRMEHNGERCDRAESVHASGDDSVIAPPALQLTHRFGRNITIDHTDDQHRITLLLPG
ncbi:MAG: hypothetical protein P4L66_11165 [Acetobacteraceae bacterium]|nr:hypothetical protein [Acetobacteraceae bacterium]